jgi:glycosyltransferase involved in cell wall biosynthesis
MFCRPVGRRSVAVVPASESSEVLVFDLSRSARPERGRGLESGRSDDHHVCAAGRERLGMSPISVLTPSRGYGRYIADAIESVRQQDDVTVQHVVQDAKSDDETLDVLRSYGDAVDWTSEPDRGQSDALNRALARASGDWIAWLNADEFYLPGGLRMLLDAGEDNAADVVYGDCVTVDDDGRLLALRPQHQFNRTILRLYGPFLASVSVLIRRSSLVDAPWDTSLIQVMDWDAYLALASRGASFLHVAYPVGAFRLHEDQASMRTKHVRRETAEVRARFGIPSGPWAQRVGPALHRLAKLAAGSYVRQARATRLRGRDLRWFDGRDGAETFRRLLDRCY